MTETTKIHKQNIFHNDCVQNVCESEMGGGELNLSEVWGNE